MQRSLFPIMLDILITAFVRATVLNRPMFHGVISGYDVYVVLDATRGIGAKTIDAALADMKSSGLC